MESPIKRAFSPLKLENEPSEYENSPYRKKEKRTTLPGMSKISNETLKKDENSKAFQMKLISDLSFDSPKKKVNEGSGFGINQKTSLKPNINNHIQSKDEQSSSPQLKSKESITLNQLNSLSLTDNVKQNKIKFQIKPAFKTKAGNNCGQPKTNQDSSLCKLNGLKVDGFNLYSVMDGHGNHGHYVSNSVRSMFQDFIFKPSHYDSSPSLGSIYKKIKDKDYDHLKRCFQYCETSLAKSKYEVNFSGTTAVMVIQLDDILICANTGDSRAIVGTTEGVKALSNDHKPELPLEKERIIANGGRVDRFNDGGELVGPYRVWMKYEDYPGLAMSRSLGDFVSKSVGCSSIPEMKEYQIDSKTQFLVVASDGIWEFLDNQMVYKYVEPYYYKNDPEGACTKIIEESAKIWKQVSRSYLFYF